MRTIVIGLKDLRLRLRDRSAIILAFIAPLVLATIISFAFRNEEVPFQTTIAVADLDRTDLTRSFVEGVREVPALEEAVTLEVVGSEEEARSLLEGEKAFSAIVIPAGFSDAVQAGREAELRVIRMTEAFVSGEVAEALASGFTAEINATRLAIQTAIDAGALHRSDSPGLPALIDRASQQRIPAQLVDGPIGAREVTTASYFGPSMSIFFLLFTVQFGAIGILRERQEGTLARLLAAPLKPSTVVLGKLLSSFVLGLISMISMIFATRVLLGATWGDPLAVAVLTLSIVLAAMAVTGLVITLAKTNEQAQGFGSIAAVGLALLGGNFIQITDAPWLIRQLSLATPNGWALRGFFDLAAEGGGIETIVEPITAILAFAFVCGVVALLRGRRLVVA